MEIKKLIEDLDLLESAKDKYLRITYNGKEVDVYTITRFIGTIIPEDYDNSKLKAEIVDAQNLKETEERYLSVEPDGLILYQGDKVEAKTDAPEGPWVNLTDDDIRKIAKEHFDNITDDIRVQWY